MTIIVTPNCLTAVHPMLVMGLSSTYKAIGLVYINRLRYKNASGSAAYSQHVHSM